MFCYYRTVAILCKQLSRNSLPTGRQRLDIPIVNVSAYMQGTSKGNGQFSWGASNLVNMQTPSDFNLGDFTGQ